MTHSSPFLSLPTGNVGMQELEPPRVRYNHHSTSPVHTCARDTAKPPRREASAAGAAGPPSLHKSGSIKQRKRV
ncbi:hypothetical protein E2C01_035659 [Portunus trituberculatus]|uniref:Uncharacterized protein n=1 Tax=Portunus trituberculatus TaxID=210409 RepID=A0A5B7F9S1_PORTR|nr:hypothetical protein [Portunus trituberculatus]